jgi:hypothetical protein
MPPKPKDVHNKQERKDKAQKFQSAVQKLANSPGFQRALEEFEEDPDGAKADPRGFLTSRGVDIPADATVEVLERQGSYCYCWRVCVFWWCADFCVCV